MSLAGSGTAALYTGPTERTGGVQACSGPNVDVSQELAAAVSNPIYYSGPICGEIIRVIYEGKTVDARIVDNCYECQDHNIKLSQPAFDRIEVDPGEGTIQVSWTIVDPATSTETPRDSGPVSSTIPIDTPRALAPGAIAGVVVGVVGAVVLLVILAGVLLRRRHRQRPETSISPVTFGQPLSEKTGSEPISIAAATQPPIERTRNESTESRAEVAQLHAAMRRAGFSIPGVIQTLRGAAPPAYDEAHTGAGRA